MAMLKNVRAIEFIVIAPILLQTLDFEGQREKNTDINRA